MTNESADARAAFERLHHEQAPLLLPNAWDYASAAALFAAGFPAVATTSLGVAIAAGKADGRGSTRADTLGLVGLIAPLGPVTVDIERGFSDCPREVADLAAGLARHGAVGINIEDGLDEQSLIDLEQQHAKIAAVKERVPELFVNARVDTYWNGVSANVEETVRRAHRYIEAGADGIFVPGTLGRADIEALADAITRPLNVLYAPAAHRLAELAELGVRRVSTGSLLFRGAIGNAVRIAEEIRAGSRTAGSGAPTFSDLQALVLAPAAERPSSPA